MNPKPKKIKLHVLTVKPTNQSTNLRPQSHQTHYHHRWSNKREEEGFRFRERKKVEDWTKKEAKVEDCMLCPCCWSPLPFLLPISSSNSSRPIFCPLLFLSCGLGYFSTNPIWKQVVSDRERQRLIETNATQTNLGFLAPCECLDCADSCVFSYIFFFFSAREQYPHMGSLFTYCSCTVHVLFTH